MNQKIARTIAFTSVALVSVVAAAWLVRAQNAKALYPSMAPLDQYLMPDRNAEIALTRRAAPTSISSDATVLVFEKSGYQTAVEGKNGFTCLVERSWVSPFNSPYMMSKAGHLGDAVGHWCPHLMFHVPKTEDASWGADLAGSPVLFNDEYRDVPEPETIFMVPVFRWSDGTAAPH